MRERGLAGDERRRPVPVSVSPRERHAPPGASVRAQANTRGTPVHSGAQEKITETIALLLVRLQPELSAPQLYLIAQQKVQGLLRHLDDVVGYDEPPMTPETQHLVHDVEAQLLQLLRTMHAQIRREQQQYNADCFPRVQKEMYQKAQDIGGLLREGERLLEEQDQQPERRWQKRKRKGVQRVQMVVAQQLTQLMKQYELLQQQAAEAAPVAAAHTERLRQAGSPPAGAGGALPVGARDGHPRAGEGRAAAAAAAVPPAAGDEWPLGVQGRHPATSRALSDRPQESPGGDHLIARHHRPVGADPVTARDPADADAGAGTAAPGARGGASGRGRRRRQHRGRRDRQR